MAEHDAPSTSPAGQRRDTRTARQRAADMDRDLAATQPDPQLGPIRIAAREPILAGTIPLPFASFDHDPAGIGNPRSRVQRGIKPRVTECVACEYRKLETRLEREVLGPPRVRRPLSAEQLAHLGPGERKYTLCKVCHDTNGLIEPGLYALWAPGTAREDAQRSLRFDPEFHLIAERVAEVERWRASARGEIDLAAGLTDFRGQDAAPLDLEGEYDGLPLDERVSRLSDFTGQRDGFADTEFSAGAPYDSAVVGADETEAYLLDGKWEASRADIWRRARERANDIEDHDLRSKTLARLVERWDPRMSLAETLEPADTGVGEYVDPLEQHFKSRLRQRVEVTNPLAPVERRHVPFPGSAAHSGVDEGFADEPAWKQSALARHEARVAKFLRETRVELEEDGWDRGRIDAYLTLPEINPRREVGKFTHDAPLHERIEPGPRVRVDVVELGKVMARAAGTEMRVPDGAGTRPEPPRPRVGDLMMAARRDSPPLILAPSAALDAIAAEADLRRSVRDDVDSFVLQETRARAGARDALITYHEGTATVEPVDAPSTAAFLQMAEHARARAEFRTEIQAADAERERLQSSASNLERANRELNTATTKFGEQIEATFADPERFVDNFIALEPGQQRAALTALRERPGTFATEFASDFGRECGTAGALAPGIAEDRTAVLTEDAGRRFLDATISLDATRRVVARELGMAESTSVSALADECTTRMRAVSTRKDAAISSRDVLPVVSPKQLRAAFSALHPSDRTRVAQQVPTLTSLLTPRRRELAKSGPSL
jgi:hypothetical protein